MRKKAEIMDRDAVNRALIRISHEITEKNSGAKDLVIVGIKRRGVSLAKFIYQKIGQIEGTFPEYAELDTTMYRDDIEKSTLDNKSSVIVEAPALDITNLNLFNTELNLKILFTTTALSLNLKLS